MSFRQGALAFTDAREDEWFFAHYFFFLRGMHVVLFTVSLLFHPHGLLPELYKNHPLNQSQCTDTVLCTSDRYFKYDTNLY